MKQRIVRTEEEEFLEMYKLIPEDVEVREFYKIFIKMYPAMRKYHWERGVQDGINLQKEVYNKIYG